MSNWGNFYAQRINSTYQDYFNTRYDAFLRLVEELSNEKGIFELGCGIGSVSKALNLPFKGVDISTEMVRLANENTNSNNFYTKSIFDVEFEKGLTYVSHGVLEHFKDEDIVKITNKFAQSIHYVPLDKYKTPSFGDERLLPYEYWLELVNPVAYKLFNDNHDLLFIL